MGSDGKKLSKRHGSTSIDEFRRQGISPEALINYIAMVGASYEDGKDIYTLEELAKLFSLEKLSKSPAIFDYKKLEWFNGHYIRMKSDDELAARALPFAVESGLFGEAGQEPEPAQKELFSAAMPLIKERVVFLAEIPGKIRYLFSEFPLPPKEEFFPKKAGLEETISFLNKGRSIVSSLINTQNDEEAELFIKTYAEQQGVKLGDIMMPLRISITGTKVSPPLFGSIRLLGVEKTLARIDRALDYLV